MKPVYIEIDKYGDRFYYSDAAMTKLHRTDGPACERANGTKFWYLNGQCHRTDGPAIEYANGAKEWRLNGEHLSETEFLAATATEVVLTLDMIAAKFGVSVENLKIKK